MIIKTQLWNRRSVFVCVCVWGRGVGWWEGEWAGRGGVLCSFGCFCIRDLLSFGEYVFLVLYPCSFYLFTNAIILLWEISLLSFVLV